MDRPLANLWRLRWLVGDGEPRPHCHFQAVSPQYFRTLGIDRIEGRTFGTGDDATVLPVVVICRRWCCARAWGWWLWGWGWGWGARCC